MKFVFNPVTGNFDLINIGVNGVPFGNIYSDYSAMILNPPTRVSLNYVTSPQGTKWLPGSLGGTYYTNGWYFFDGNTYTPQPVPFQAIQQEVDAGTNTEKFVTPLTFENATKWATKQATLVSTTNIKTINGVTILGAGDLTVSGADATKLAILNNLSDLNNTATARANIGLGSVDNTSDVLKPISTATQTALDTKTDKLITANRQEASYILVLGDADKLVEMNVDTVNNLTIPLNSTVAYSIGTKIMVSQYGIGQTTIVATSGVIINYTADTLKLRAQNSSVTLLKIGIDEWYAWGDLEMVSGGSINTLTADSILSFSSEDDTVVNTINSALITAANIKSFSYVCKSNATTSLDDFKLNGVTFNIENIVDNTSFDIRATAINNATGNYTIKYLINY